MPAKEWSILPGVQGSTNKSVSGFRKTFKRLVNPEAEKRKIVCVSTCYWTDLPGLLGVPLRNDLHRGGHAGREYVLYH